MRLDRPRESTLLSVRTCLSPSRTASFGWASGGLPESFLPLVATGTRYAYSEKGERMTSIKPPTSGPNGPHPLPDTFDGPDASAGPHRADGTAPGSLQPTTTQQANSAAASSQVGGAGGVVGDPIAHLAHAVEAGTLTPDQAVEQLLGQALSRAQRHLSGPELAELTGLLRDALLSDPTLAGLRSKRG